nr:ribosomal RNA small subunit methyltransferase A [Cryptomonas curvata]
MNKVINEIINSKLHRFEDNLLVNLKSPAQVSFFLKLKRNLVTYILVSKKTIVNIKYKKIILINLQNFSSILPAFRIFISINPRVNNENFFLRVIMKKPICKKAFFLCNQIITRKLLNKFGTECNNRSLFYLKILARIKIFNINVSLDFDKNIKKILKLVPRKMLPIVNFFKWDGMLKLFYSQKKQNIGKFLKSTNFLMYFYQIMMNNSIFFSSITTTKEHLQRIFEESGIVSKKIISISIKDFFFFFNNF